MILSYHALTDNYCQEYSDQYSFLLHMAAYGSETISSHHGPVYWTNIIYKCTLGYLYLESSVSSIKSSSDGGSSSFSGFNSQLASTWSNFGNEPDLAWLSTSVTASFLNQIVILSPFCDTSDRPLTRHGSVTLCILFINCFWIFSRNQSNIISRQVLLKSFMKNCIPMNVCRTDIIDFIRWFVETVLKKKFHHV